MNKIIYINYKSDVIYACRWLVLNEDTIGNTAKECGYSKTTLWRRIHTVCKAESPELYKQVKKQLKKNSKRGGRRKKC